MEKYLVFTFIYLTLQNLLMIAEYNPYVDMLENIQKDVIDGTSTPYRFLKTLVLYVIIYGSMTYLFIRYLLDKSTYLESFIFGSIVVLVLDFTLVAFFDKAENHIPIVLFDTFVLGGLGTAAAIYLVRNYTKILIDNLPVLGIFFGLSLIAAFYVSFRHTQIKLKEKQDLKASNRLS